jgi:DNA-binding CsgD family transcriptional regulator
MGKNVNDDSKNVTNVLLGLPTPVSLVIRILAFSVLVTSYCILTNGAYPSLRSPEGIIMLNRTLGMVLGFSIITFVEPALKLSLRMRHLLWVPTAVVVICGLMCFVLIMAVPQLLHSPFLAFILGLLIAAVLVPWVTAFEGIDRRHFFLCVAYIPVISVIILVLLLLLPELIHMYAVLAASLVAFVPGVWLALKRLRSKDSAGQVQVMQAIDRPTLVRIVALATGTGFAYALIRFMSFERIYENPNTLYLAFCLLLFLMTEAIAFVVLWQMKLRKLPLHILAVSFVCLLSVIVCMSSWMGHQGLFVFMGLVMVFTNSFLFSLLYAWRRSLPVAQTVSAAQFGMSLGILIAVLGSSPLSAAGVSVEMQIVALFVFIALFCVVFFFVILGTRRAQTPDVAASHKAFALQAINQKYISADAAQDESDGRFIKLLADNGATPRQTEVALLAAKGYSIPMVAEKLVLSKKTVDNHLSCAYRVLEIHSRQELVDLYQTTAHNRSSANHRTSQ